MRNKHITRFGSMLAQSGALYFVTDEHGLVRMEMDMELEQLRAKRRLITPEIESEVKSDVLQRKTEYHQRINSIGVPDKFKDLLSLTKKAEVEQYIKELVITEYDLFLLIHNCSQIQFTHRSKFKQYIPEHLKVSNTDLKEMETGNPKKFLKKNHSSLLERKYIHVHLFEYSSNWHCFYFTHRDIEEADNHWKYGCHLHYISYLWSGFKKRIVWNEFNKRATDISGSFHIRFEPFEFLDYTSDNSEKNAGEKSPSTNIFEPNLAAGCGSRPLPFPHLETRGLWVAKAKFRRH